MSGFANEYADGMYSLARDEGFTESALAELDTIADAFVSERAFVQLLDNRAVPLSSREAALREVLSGRVHPYILNFLMLLTKRGGIREFPACVKRFRDDYYSDNNISLAEVCSASPLTDDQRESVRAKISEITGKRIILKERVDASLLGGIRVDVDGRRIDNTLKTRMETLKRLMRQDA